MMGETVRLNSRFLGGEGKPRLVILHGLMGSSRNWTLAGRDLTSSFHVDALDLRNHGDSPHAEKHDYASMAADLELWLNERGCERISLLGHSMGGKTAMRFACHHPDRVNELYIADISPKAYHPRFANTLSAMAELDPEGLRSREEAEDRLEPAVPDADLRRFLLTNLIRDRTTGRYRWQLNLPVLLRDLPAITGPALDPDDSFSGPTLFIRGGNSPYIEDTDRELIRCHFPHSHLITLKESGHNVHVDQRSLFVQTVLSMQRYVREGKLPGD